MASADCKDERNTQHHLGVGFGFGPVRNDENLLFAVFSGTPRDTTTRKLLKGAFETRQLVRAEVSVARRIYTQPAEFQTRVVDPAVGRENEFVGVACVAAEVLRLMPFSMAGVNGRAVCVLDKVSPSDFDGHAALAYSEGQQSLTPKQRAAIRELIRADLADAFGEIIAIDVAFSD
jgi:hypothetical protein